MSKKETHFHHISISSKYYQSTKDAINDANALKVWLQRNCAKKAYNCLCYIGVSEINHQTGKISCGKRGKKEISAYAGMKCRQVNPHIHIILLSNPAETLSKSILEYFTRKGISGYHKCCDEYIVNAVPYVMEQSSACRTVAYGSDQLPSDMVAKFYELIEATNKAMNGRNAIFDGLSDSYFNGSAYAAEEEQQPSDPFTFLCNAGLQDLAEEPIVLRSEWEGEELPCNSKYNNLINQLRANKEIKFYELLKTIQSISLEPRRGLRAGAPLLFDIIEFKNHPINHYPLITYFQSQRRLI